MWPSSKRNNTVDARIVVGKTAVLGFVSCCSLQRSHHVRLNEDIRSVRVAAVAESAPDRPGSRNCRVRSPPRGDARCARRSGRSRPRPCLERLTMMFTFLHSWHGPKAA
jgi:hypothetical protein